MTKFKLFSIIVPSVIGTTIVIPPVVIAAVESNRTNNGGFVHEQNVYFRTPKLADTITVIDLSGFDSDLKDDINTTFQSLEGLIVQEKGQAEIFVKSGVNERDRWFYDMQYKYGFKVHVVNNVNFDPQKPDVESIWTVLRDYKNLFNSRFIQYTKSINVETDPDFDNISVNNATMVSACDHYLMASNKLLTADNGKYRTILANFGIAEATGTDVWDPDENTPLDTFKHYENQLNNTMLLNQSPVDFVLRDYAIAAKIPTVCVGLEEDTSRDYVASKMKPNSPIFGWSHGFDGSISHCGAEQDYLIWSTTHKFNVLASDHCYNLTFYSYDKARETYHQPEHKKIKANPNKHYLAIVMSDGDNIQWMQNDFLTSDEYWGSPYRGEFPLSWTMSPTPIDLNNSVLEEMYATASANDELIAGPSGYAYINPAWYYQDSLMDDYNAFAQRTAGYMQDCDLSVCNVLDFQNPTYLTDDPQDTDPICMTPFMQQEQIKGLVWSLDGLSLDGHGSVNWINDKPLLSFREGIWDNDYLHRDRVIERLRSYPRNIHKIDGYTALVVNVWAAEGKMYNLHEFVRALPADVELVTISQLLQLISDNVPHVDDVPTDYPRP
ncbi:MAG: hypothetical protein ACOQNV_00990 [Mycoplasmoidaceae bacterium]